MPDHRIILQDQSATVPRYTSYPTAPHFRPEIGSEILDDTIRDLPADERISLYLHIPFCDRLCWFCGCNTKQVNRYAPVSRYVDALVNEIELIGQKFNHVPPVAQIHFGGGSPSMLRTEDFARLSRALNKSFDLDSGTRVSVELDPNDASSEMMQGLEIIGLTRASIGVQDFDPVVQKAINRPQTYEETAELVRKLRDCGVESLNIDALYGLPLQNRSRLLSTLEKVVSMHPDRIALFGYAHVPWVKKHQTMINDADLPDTFERFEHAELARELLVSAGYEKIGIDHYALPHDSLSKAAREGKLRRNFQGYTDDRFDTLIGLGASSIGQSSIGYFQNLVPTGQYMLSVANGLLPTNRGYRFLRDDRIRSWIIGRLMCDFGFSYDQLQENFDGDVRGYIVEAGKIAESDHHGLCQADKNGFALRPGAEAFTRIVASRFDAHLNDMQFRYSKAV